MTVAFTDHAVFRSIQRNVNPIHALLVIEHGESKISKEDRWSLEWKIKDEELQRHEHLRPLADLRVITSAHGIPTESFITTYWEDRKKKESVHGGNVRYSDRRHGRGRERRHEQRRRDRMASY